MNPLIQKGPVIVETGHFFPGMVIPLIEGEYTITKLIDSEQEERCARGACLTKDRVIHEWKIVCRYCLRPGEPCQHPKTSTCTSCDKSNLETRDKIIKKLQETGSIWEPNVPNKSSQTNIQDRPRTVIPNITIPPTTFF